METPDIALKALVGGGILYRLCSILISGATLLAALALSHLDSTEKFLAFPLLGYKTKLCLLGGAALLFGYLAVTIGRTIFGPLIRILRSALAKAFPKWFPWHEMSQFDHRLLNRIAGEMRTAMNFEPFEQPQATAKEWASFVETMTLYYMLRSHQLYQVSEFIVFRLDLSVGAGTALLVSAAFAAGMWRLWLALGGIVFLVLVIPVADRWPIFYGRVISAGYLEDHFRVPKAPED
ncbi:MAG: hypothetical protein ACRD4H_02050 [Candidatus Acidiferrales bacterium]